MIDAKGVVHPHQLPTGETIANSFAMDESGGVFIVSDAALYRFDVVKGKPERHLAQDVRPRQPDQARPGQPGQRHHPDPDRLGQLAGRRLDRDHRQRRPPMNVLVFRRGKAGPGPPLCKQPIFAADQSADENSLISVPGGLIVENNYGYEGPLPAGVTTRSPTPRPDSSGSTSTTRTAAARSRGATRRRASRASSARPISRPG